MFKKGEKRRGCVDTLPDYPRSYAEHRKQTFWGRKPLDRDLGRSSTLVVLALLSARWASLAASSYRSRDRWRSSRLRADCQTCEASLSPAKSSPVDFIGIHEIFSFFLFVARQWKLWKLNHEIFHADLNFDNEAFRSNLIIHDCLSTASLRSDLNNISMKFSFLWRLGVKKVSLKKYFH